MIGIKDKLLILSSDEVATVYIQHDVLRADYIGRTARDAFIEDRLMDSREFFEFIKTKNLKTRREE